MKSKWAVPGEKGCADSRLLVRFRGGAPDNKVPFVWWSCEQVPGGIRRGGSVGSRLGGRAAREGTYPGVLGRTSNVISGH